MTTKKLITTAAMAVLPSACAAPPEPQRSLHLEGARSGQLAGAYGWGNLDGGSDLRPRRGHGRLHRVYEAPRP